MIRRFLSSAGMRILLLPISGVASILVARIISGSAGAEDYAIFALVAGLPLLVPFADLGLGAAATNAAVRLPDSSQEFVETVDRARRTLILVGFVVGLIVVVIGAFGLWPVLLGVGDSQQANLGITIALSLFASSIPAGLGARILVGMRKNTLVTAVQTMNGLVAFAGVLIVSLNGGNLVSYLPFSTLGPAVTAWILFYIAVRQPAYREALRVAPSANLLTVRLWDTAAPMMVMSIVLPITYQSERLIVSVVSGTEQLAVYTAGALLYLPALSVIQVATRSFWGEFGSAHSMGLPLRPMLIRALALSAALGLVAATAFALVGKPVSEWAVDSQVSIPFELIVILASSLLLNAVHLPSGMLLTDASGLRFQSGCALVAAVFALPTSIFLASLIGALGPPLATLVSLAFFQLAPCLLAALYRTRTSRLSP